MTHLLCVGLGYSARVLAARMAARGWRITGTSTSESGTAAIAALGYDALRYDGSAPTDGLRAALASSTHLLVSAPPDANGDPLLRHHVSALAPPLTWIGYLSTIGVYGDHNGAWVDEETPPTPTNIRSRQRVDAERAWLDASQRTGIRTEIFRLPGIYGPGRGPLAALRNGTARAIDKPGHIFNRIHVEDIANVLEAAIARPTPHTIYNVTDDEPAATPDVLAFAARLLELPPPPTIDFATADLTPMARSFYSECKRVSNARIKSALGVALSFPTYRDGFARDAALISR